MKLNPTRVSFGRHESFPLRFGWITKGLDALAHNPNVFAAEDATVVLGVGKNMVAAMRYWLLATGMAERTEGSGLARTALGEIVFPDGDGGDRYLEDDTSIWLLHWQLATNSTGATAIHWFYNHFHKPAFTSDEVFAGLRDFVQQSTAKVAVTTLKRDANLVLRMYAQSRGGTRLLAEDALDSPLAALLLLERLDRQTWHAMPTERAEIPLTAFGYAVADVLARADVNQLPVERLMYSGQDHCAPGAVFRMTEAGLTDKLEELCAEYPDCLRLDRTAGLYQMYRLAPLAPLDVLKSHYAPVRNKGKGTQRSHSGAKAKRRRSVGVTA